MSVGCSKAGVFLLIAAIVSLLAVGPAAAVEVAEAEALVKNVVADASAAFSGGSINRDEAKAGIGILVEKYADVPFEAELLLGRHWRKADAEQRKAFTDVLVPFFVATYGEMIDDAQAKPRIDVLGGEPVEGGVLVHSLLVPPGEEAVKVDWTIAVTPAGKVVVADIAADGVTLVTTMRSDFTSVIRSGGGRIEALVEAMKKKIDRQSVPAKRQSGGG